MSRHLYLTGYRGTGKTSVGVLLARKLECPIIDLDQVVSANAGKSIREIFDAGGEQLFRDKETEALETVSLSDPAVISLGGGAILRQENRQIIRQTGLCFWLDADAATIYQRIESDAATAEQRPALTSMEGLAEVESLLEARRHLYREAADHRIDTAGQSIPQVSQQVYELWCAAEA